MTAKISQINLINEQIELLEYTRDAMKVPNKSSAVMVFDNDEFDIPEDIANAILVHHETLILKRLAELGVDPNA